MAKARLPLLTLALLAVIATVCWQLRSKPRVEAAGDDAAETETTFTPHPAPNRHAVRAIYLGGAAGGLLAFPIGLIVGYAPDPALLVGVLAGDVYSVGADGLAHQYTAGRSGVLNIDIPRRTGAKGLVTITQMEPTEPPG